MSYAEEERERAQTQPVTFNKFSGVKNTVSKERLSPDELESAVNVDLDDVGQPFSRRGRTRVATGDFHSLWTGYRRTYGVKDGVLGAINSDYSFVALQSGVGSDAVSFDQIADTVYFSSRSASGKIDELTNTVSGWGALVSEGEWLSPVVNPTSYLNPEFGRLVGAPPMAEHILHHNGRMWFAQDNLLWASELYLYDYVDKTRSFFQLEGEVVAMGAVTDGIYVGTEYGCFYMDGPLDRRRIIQVSSSPVIPGSMVSASSDVARPDRVQTRKAVIFMSEDGIRSGLDSGVCYNMTEDKVLFPKADSAAVMFRKQDGMNHYVTTLNSGGTPTSTARVGDYVDAEIVRHSS